MGSTLTNELIRLAYKETSELERELLLTEMQYDSELKEQFQLIRSIGRELDRLKKEPSTACTDFVLSYSKRHSNMPVAC